MTGVETYPFRTEEQLRFGDVDRQGHINNSAYSAYLENNRTALLYDPVAPLMEVGQEFVIAKITIEFKAELHWPGVATVGLRVDRLGRSSLALAQGVFDGDRLVVTAESVIVLLDSATRRSTPLSDAARARIAPLIAPGQAEA